MRAVLAIALVTSACVADGAAPVDQRHPACGAWVIHSMIDTKNIQDVPNIRLIGRRFNYGLGEMRSTDPAVTRRVSYRVSKISADDFLFAYHFDKSQLGIDADPVTVVDVIADGRIELAELGGQLLVKNPDVLITHWAGVYYELRRTSPCGK